MSDSKTREYLSEMGNCFFVEILEIIRNKNFIDPDENKLPGERVVPGDISDYLKALSTFVTKCDLRKKEILDQGRLEKDPTAFAALHKEMQKYGEQMNAIETLLQAELRCEYGPFHHYKIVSGWALVASF